MWGVDRCASDMSTRSAALRLADLGHLNSAAARATCEGGRRTPMCARLRAAALTTAGSLPSMKSRGQGRAHNQSLPIQCSEQITIDHQDKSIDT